MFNFKVVNCLVILCSSTFALPIDDVQIVESTIREVRAALPDDLHLAETTYGHDYGADDEDSVGYLKRTEDGGNDGYSHFDSYHKKDGDNYGYEKHSSFGKADHAAYDAEADDKEEGDKENYKVSEDVNEDDNAESYEDGESEKYTDTGDFYIEADDSDKNTGKNEHLEYDTEDGKQYEALENYEADEDADY